ncbi:MAG: hypothetical protein AAGF11_43615 [Myxococcota bacterium]
MPSHKHQSLTKLLTESPTLVPMLVRELLGLDVSDDFELLPSPETVREIDYPEYSADGTVLIREVDDASREAFIVEVQLRPDDDKLYSWPLYVAGVRLRLGCPTTLVVVTDDAATAAWSAQPIDLGRGRMVLHPLVIGPAEIPRQLELSQAREIPGLAVLAVITHGLKDGAERLGRTALAATEELATTDPVRATLYADLILAYLSEDAVKALEDEMGVSTDAYISDFAKRYVSKGRAEALLVVVESRGFTVSDELRGRIIGCTDVELLDTWLARAATAENVDMIFND